MILNWGLTIYGLLIGDLGFWKNKSPIPNSKSQIVNFITNWSFYHQLVISTLIFLLHPKSQTIKTLCQFVDNQINLFRIFMSSSGWPPLYKGEMTRLIARPQNLLNKPAAQAAGADPSQCNSASRQNPPIQQNHRNF